MCAQNIVQVGFQEWELNAGKNIQWVDYGTASNRPILYSVAVVPGPATVKLVEQVAMTPGYILHLTSGGAVITQLNHDPIEAISIDLDTALIQNGTLEISTGQTAVFTYTRVAEFDPVDLKPGPGVPPPRPPKTAEN